MERSETKALLPTRREVVSRIFRQRTIFAITFLLVLAAFVVTGQFKPKYRAEMKILVRKQRVDPVVTTGQDSTPMLQTMGVREEDLNSEAEVLKGEGLAREVTLQAGLVRPGSDPPTLEKAVRKLQHRLDVAVVSKTDLIDIRYESQDPEQSRRVLVTLASLYLQRQRNVLGPDFQVTFFEQQVHAHGAALDDAEARLLAFIRRTGVVSAGLQSELAVRQMEDLSQTEMQNGADIAEARGRTRQLASSLASEPARLETEQKQSDNPQLLNQLNATLLSLQLKRTDLLNKYDPGYRLVQDADREIAVTQSMIAAQLASPVHDRSSGVNPSHTALETELANARAQLTGLQAKGSALSRSAASMEKTAQNLAQRTTEQDALLRHIKTEKDVLQLSVDKLEQARMTHSLDKDGILNVAVAEEPTVPALPQTSFPAMLAACLFACTLFGLGAAFLADIFDPTVRNAEELSDVAGLPTLAVFGSSHSFEGIRA